MDATGFQLRIQAAALSDASASVVGQCLTVGDETMSRYPNENQARIGYKIGATLQNVFNLMLIRQVEPFLHLMDAGLAYYSGVINGIGQILEAQFASQCNPPEIYLKDVAQCACGDTGLAIPAAQAAQTWQQRAFWCSGTLSMVDGANNPFVVFNPYSYAQLQAKAAGRMQAYLECASQSYQCDPPTDPEFDLQGVTLLNVLVKCRENFIKKQWDPAAYVLFDPTQAYRYRTRQRLQIVQDDVSACLASQAQAGALNSPCLDNYLAALAPPMEWEFYWAYERSLPVPPATSLPPERVDACLTFSGPASKGFAVFQDCVDDETLGVCTLSGHAWSPLSNNSVPVGQPHTLMYHGRQSDSLILRLYEDAYQTVNAALDAAINHWSVDQSNVNTQFFSSEGDVSDHLSLTRSVWARSDMRARR